MPAAVAVVAVVAVTVELDLSSWLFAVRNSWLVGLTGLEERLEGSDWP
jgi:hypothetical protein